MDPAPYGMFGPHGFLANLEDEEGKDKSNSNENDLNVNQDNELKAKAEITTNLAHLNVDKDLEAEAGNEDELTPPNSEEIFLEQSPNQFLPLNSLPAAQAVFSIEKIRKNILSFSKPWDLVNFRLVSRDWRRNATNNTLLNWFMNEITMIRNFKAEKLRMAEEITDIPFKYSLQGLTEVMDGTGPNTFPCSNFTIFITNLQDNSASELQTFFDKHGTRIRELKLELHYYKSCFNSEYPENEILLNGFEQEQQDHICRCCKNWVLQFLTKLLLKQAPNLESLRIGFILFKNDDIDIDDDVLLDGSCIPSENNFNVNPMINSYNLNLKSLYLEKEVAPILFNHFCTLAPRLKEIETEDFINIKLYLEPTNRLYLLKDLLYYPSQHHTSPERELIKRVANTEGNLHLKSLRLNLENVEKDPNPTNLHVIVEICNKLLERSCHSLKAFGLTPVGFLRGLSIPQMPQVNFIYFIASRPENSVINYFPREMCMSETFPKLEKIKLGEKFSSCFETTENVLLNSVEEEVPSVIEVDTTWNDDVNTEQFEKWFPNAMIS